MATFAIAAPEQNELAGPMSELGDTLIAVSPRSNVLEISTAYGKQQAIRVQVVDAKTGEDYGLRLLYWSEMRRQVLTNAAKGIDFTVGVITEHEQSNYPDRSFFSLDVPEDLDVDWAQVQSALNSFERAELAKTQPALDSTPF
jgi:hypothetical protein